MFSLSKKKCFPRNSTISGWRLRRRPVIGWTDGSKGWNSLYRDLLGIIKNNKKIVIRIRYMVAVLGIWRAGPGFSRKWPQFSSSTLISLIWGCWGEQRVSELHLTRRKQKKCFPCWKLGFKKYSQKWKQQTKIVPRFFKHMPMHSMHIHFKNWKKKKVFLLYVGTNSD